MLHGAPDHGQRVSVPEITERGRCLDATVIHTREVPL